MKEHPKDPSPDADEADDADESVNDGLRILEAHPGAHKMEPEDCPPEVWEITLGGVWIDGQPSRRKQK